MAKNLVDYLGRLQFIFKPAACIEDEVTTARLNALRDANNMNCLLPGTGYTLKKQPGGTTINIGGRGGDGSSVHPYQGFDASSGSTAKVTVQYGTHNSVVPTISGTPLSVTLADNLLTLGGSDTIVYIQCDLDGNYQITDASIHSGTTLPTSDDTTAYQILFAVAITTDGSGNASVAIAGNVLGSQAFQYCGGSHLFGLV